MYNQCLECGTEFVMTLAGCPVCHQSKEEMENSEELIKICEDHQVGVQIIIFPADRIIIRVLKRKDDTFGDLYRMVFEFKVECLDKMIPLLREKLKTYSEYEKLSKELF